MRGGRGGGFGRRPIYRGYRHIPHYPVFWGMHRFMWFPWLLGLGGFILLLMMISMLLR